ncbi:hypothetical protein DRE_04172 [Drechslerella stenobrocha 248]|uniref:Cleavage and polyadenylation specificity factor subunit 2 n=1 Tax=Drechslerella stenobrocha 248 TaxID=1043628 RepID=W7IC65_9PEZI|nr:hypothetical protein DRE_04172 [Drechslerella stenobrocha 248]
MFQFTPLLGARSGSRASASLLLLDNGIKILVDCGWSEPFNVADLAEIERHAPTVSLILLTHPTLDHIGAYAHCCAHVPGFVRIPVYCTYPVANLGRSLLQDAYLSTPLIATTYPPATDSSPAVLLNPPSPDDIDRYFDAFNALKYSQPFSFPSPPLSGLTITAYRAGHTLGGTIWRIQHSHSAENILYAVSWNHSRDAHLSSAAFLPGPTGVSEEFLNPTAIICSPHNSLPGAIATPRRRRDELLLTAIRKAAFAGGTVLIPTDSSARILEIAYLLEHDYRNKTSGWLSSGASICLAVRTAGRTFRYVRALLEWMDESMVKEFESVGQTGRRKPKSSTGGAAEEDGLYGPFDFKHLKLIEHKRHLMRLLQGKGGGKVVITSDKSLEWGFSTDVIKEIADDERNLIILTEKGGEGVSTAGAYLYSVWKKAAEAQKAKNDSYVGNAVEAGNTTGQVVKLDNVLLDMNLGIRVPLSQEELNAHNENLKQQQLQTGANEAEAQLLETAAEAEADDQVSSSSDEEDDEDDSTLQGKALISTALQGGRKLASGGIIDEGVNVLLKNRGVHDYDVRNAKGRNRMFPFVLQRRKFDEYGEIVKPEDFVRAEEAELVTTATRTGEKIEFLGGRGSGVVIGGAATLTTALNVRDEGGVESGIGRKRKWDKVATSPQGRRNSHISKKPRHHKGRHGGTRANRNNKEQEISPPTATSDGDDSGSDSEGSDGYEPEDVGASTVCKLVINTTTVMMNNSVTFVDYEALHDGRSLRMLLPLLKPKKIILVAGSEEETEALGNDMRIVMGKHHTKDLRKRGEEFEEKELEVFTPGIGEVINVSVEADAWSVKLSDALVKMLRWQHVRGLGVVHVVGRVVEADDVGLGITAQREDGTGGDDIKMEGVVGDGSAGTGPPEGKRTFVLDILPSTVPTMARSAKPIHVGDVRLAELRKVLLDAGHTAELTGEGRLLCDGVVSVVKEGVGRVSIEDVGGGGGLLGGLLGRKEKGRFWEVRRWVYEGLAKIAGA